MRLFKEIWDIILLFSIEIASRVKTLERACRSLKSEKTLLNEELASLKDDINGKDTELKESRTAYREAQDEIAVLSKK